MMKTQSNQQNPKQGSTATTIFLKVIPLVLTAWLAIYTLTMGIAVHKQVKTFQSQGNQGGDTLSWSSEEWQLLKDKTFLEARIALAGDDSIAMTIDFQDSIIRLETKGVVLREVKFGKVEISRFFKALKPLSYAALFSKPFMITEIEGSIVKEPIQVKKLPVILRKPPKILRPLTLPGWNSWNGTFSSIPCLWSASCSQNAVSARSTGLP